MAELSFSTLLLLVLGLLTGSGLLVGSWLLKVRLEDRVAPLRGELDLWLDGLFERPLEGLLERPFEGLLERPFDEPPLLCDVGDNIVFCEPSRRSRFGAGIFQRSQQRTDLVVCRFRQWAISGMRAGLGGGKAFELRFPRL